MKVSFQISQVFSPHVAKQRVASQLPFERVAAI